MMTVMKRDIEASTTVLALLEHARDVLVADPGCIVAERPSPQERRDRCFHTQLGVEVGAASAIHHEVIVAVGLPTATDTAITMPVQWHAAVHERLFPTFEGELALECERATSRLALRGSYTVPLGLLGRFGDGVAGGRLAQQSVSAFVQEVARRLDAEIDRRLESTPRRPAAYPGSLRDVGSETFIG